jgi:hypothetical protein
MAKGRIKSSVEAEYERMMQGAKRNASVKKRMVNQTKPPRKVPTRLNEYAEQDRVNKQKRKK